MLSIKYRYTSEDHWTLGSIELGMYTWNALSKKRVQGHFISMFVIENALGNW